MALSIPTPVTFLSTMIDKYHKRGIPHFQIMTVVGIRKRGPIVTWREKRFLKRSCWTFLIITCGD